MKAMGPLAHKYELKPKSNKLQRNTHIRTKNTRTDDQFYFLEIVATRMKWQNSTL